MNHPWWSARGRTLNGPLTDATPVGPQVITYSTAMNAASKTGDWAMATALLRQLEPRSGSCASSGWLGSPATSHTYQLAISHQPSVSHQFWINQLIN